MNFLFLIGVEGSGHHMLMDVLRNFLSLPGVKNPADSSPHQLLIDHWDPDVKDPPAGLRMKNRLFGRKPLKDKIEAVFKEDQKNGTTHYFEPASFPFGQPRNALRRPDLVEFFDWFGHQLNIKPLVMYRDPVSVVYSALRRGFTDDWRLQARIVEDNYLYIERQITVCGPEKFRVLCVEDFLDKPDAYVRSLADWWHIDAGLVESGLRHIVPPMSRTDIPGTVRASLEDFFSEQRRAQWRGLLSSQRQLNNPANRAAALLSETR